MCRETSISDVWRTIIKRCVEDDHMSYAICETGGETGGEGDVAMRCDTMRNECIMRIDNRRRTVVDSRARRPRKKRHSKLKARTAGHDEKGQPAARRHTAPSPSCSSPSPSP